MIDSRLRLAFVSMLAAALAACAAGDETPLEIENPPGAGVLTRYVSMGNSLTSGFQSAGLTDSLQLRAYPVLIARQAGVPFKVPLLAAPGCPPPYTQPVFVDTARVGGLPGTACGLRVDSLPAGPVQNVALVGAFLTGAIDNSVPATPAAADIYKTLFLGGRKQVEAMVAVRPTFVSVWLGNNETLTPALGGDPDLFGLFPEATLEAALDSIVRAIRSTPARADAILIAPVNALSFTPLVQPGAYLWALEQDPATRPLLRSAGKSVSADCSPLAKGSNLVSIRAVLSLPASVPVISCADAAPGVLPPSEVQAYNARVNQIKAAVKARADANGWLYLDPDLEFAASLADPSRFRKCQGLATATPQTFAQQVAATCPGPAAPNFFGSFVSFDGVHPSSATHVAIANAIIARLNAKYALQIPPA
jgi:hypothetical protein